MKRPETIRFFKFNQSNNLQLQIVEALIYYRRGIALI